MAKKPISQRKILILSDGKPGHFNQSLGIADRLPDMSIEVVQLRYKKKWRDNLIRILARLLGGLKSKEHTPSPLSRGEQPPLSPFYKGKLMDSRLRGNDMKMTFRERVIVSLLKWGLDETSSKALFDAGEYDLILSTGSSVAAPNLLMSRLMDAKAVVCTRPSPLGISYFDLAILPEHSRPRKIPKNVLMTFGVPNRITPKSVAETGAELSQMLSLSEKPVIGVLLGGDDPYYRIPPDLAYGLCDALLDIDAQIALTSSRRTVAETDRALKLRLEGHPSCCHLVIANEVSPPNTVSGILGISDVVIVTEDSFSMVCEAGSSGKKVVILNVERKGKGNPKRERVYKMLVEQGFVKRADVSGLRDLITGLLGDDEKVKFLDDAQVAGDGIRKLFLVAD